MSTDETAPATSTNTETTTTTHSLVITRTIKASRERVWNAWTQPIIMHKWLLPDGFTLESAKVDLRTGGRYRIQQRAADGEYYTSAGTYVEVKAPEKLVFTWDGEKDGAGDEFGELEGNETQVTIELEEKPDGHTQLTLTHVNFVSIASRDGHQRGWTKWVACLANYLEEV